MKILKTLAALSLLAAGCASAAPPATCVVSGTVLDGGAVAVANTPVRFRTIAPTLVASAGIARQDLTVKTAVDGTWSLTLVQGLNAQVDIPAVGIYADTVIPSGASCPADFSALTLYARGALTPATILSTTGPSMGGDLTGSSPNPSVVGLRGKPLHADTATDGKVWVYRTASGDYRLESFPVTAAVQTVTAGQGLAVTGTATNPVVAVADGGVVAAMLGTGAAASNVGGLGGDLSGSLPSPSLAAGSVANAEVAAGANIAWTKIDKTGATASDVGAIGGTNVIATINSSSESPKIANAQLVDIAQAKVTGLVSDLAGKRNTADEVPQADVTGLVTALAAKEATANKGAVSGYAGLDSGGKVPAAQLPSTVLADGDKGDVTVSAGGTAFAVDAKAVTYSKIQDISAPDRVLGAITAGSTVEIPFTAAARALADDADAPAMRTTLGLGTASTRNVAAAGDAASAEVVKGDDTRLTNARAPSAHTHAEADVTNLVTDLAAKVDESLIITTTAPLTIDGGASADLSTGRTLAISGATTGARGSVRLAGDLAGTADSPSVAAVGGQSAANVAAGVALANAATDAATPSAIVKRSAGGSAALDVVGNLTGNASGTAANITGVAAVANGGTGQATATAGFDALSPTSAKGDLIGHDGASSVRVAAGADGTVLTADAASAAGVKWSSVIGTGSVTSVATGNGLQGGPITTTGTVDLRLNVSGGLSKILGAGFNELGIAAGGVADAMLATPAVPQARVITTTAPLTIGGGASADLSANRTLAVADAAAGSKGVIQLAGDLGGTAASPTVATVGGKTAASIATGVTLANAADYHNTGDTIVLRDPSGDFAAGTITAVGFVGPITGNVVGNVTGNITGNATGVLRDKGGTFYDVKAYGATGDGSTDDTAAIGLAITAASTGGVIYFPPGNYKFSTLTISVTGTILRGAGSGATTLSTTATGATAITLSGDSTGLEGVALDVVGVAAGSQLSLLASGADVVISDIVFSDCLRALQVTGDGTTVTGTVYTTAAAGALALVSLRAGVVFSDFNIGPTAGLTVTDAIEVGGTSSGLVIRDGRASTNGNGNGIHFNGALGTASGFFIDNVYVSGAGTGSPLLLASSTTGSVSRSIFSGGTNAVRTTATGGTVKFENCILGDGGSDGDVLYHNANKSIELYNTDVRGSNTSASNVYLAAAGAALTWRGGVLGVGNPLAPPTYAVRKAAAAPVPIITDVTVEAGSLYSVAVFSGGVLIGANVASASSITISAPVTRVTGTAAIATIAVPVAVGPITLIPDGAWTFTTAGNIAVALKATVGVPITLVYDDVTAKWYPSLSVAPLTSDGTTVTIAGPLLAQRSVATVTTTATPAATASGTLYQNEGDTDGAGVTLPTAAAGLEFTFVVQAAQLLTINAAAGDTIRVGANVTSAAGYIRSSVAGDRITLLAINSTEWIATSFAGEWTNGSWWAYDTHAQGAIYWASPAATANTTNTPVKCAGTTAAQGAAVKVTQATTNRLTYTGTPTRNFSVEVTVGISAAAATTGKLHLYKNGSLITGATITRVIPNTDIGAMAIHALVSMATNDYVELWCETNDEDDLTIQNGVLSLTSID